MSKTSIDGPFPQAGLTFLRDLAENNQKEWFAANKKRYEKELKGPARALIAAINLHVQGISPRHVTPPAKAINRINRDIRFSKDKTPYNTNVWAGWHPQDAPKGAGAGFYFGFSYDSAGVGCGAWSPDKNAQAALREHFAANYDEWRALVGGADFGYELGARDAYKRVPKPYPADHPAAELLKLKGVHFKGSIAPELITSLELPALVAERFRELAPVVAFMNRGLGV